MALKRWDFDTIDEFMKRAGRAAKEVIEHSEKSTPQAAIEELFNKIKAEAQDMAASSSGKPRNGPGLMYMNFKRR